MTRRILVTGGASGLGAALAAQWLARGERVLVTDLAPERPSCVPDAAEYLTLDVRSQPGWDAAAEWVHEQWGGLDVLVNNAGIPSGGRIDIETIEEWERVLDINLLGAVRGCRTFVPMMKEQRSGTIVNTASLAGLVHGAGMSSYNAAKAGVVALSETLWSELRPWGIQVSVVCPGFFRTNLHERFSGTDTALAAHGTKLITRAKLGAAEVAAVVVAAVDKGTFLILPERQARAGYWAKRAATPLYRRFLVRTGEGLRSAPLPDGSRPGGSR